MTCLYEKLFHKCVVFVLVMVMYVNVSSTAFAYDDSENIIVSDSSSRVNKAVRWKIGWIILSD